VAALGAVGPFAPERGLETSHRILVVDDDETQRHLLVAILGTLGCEVESAGTGGEALDLVRTHHPEMVLLDVDLPDMDGLSAMRQIKGDPATAETMVLMVTGATDGAIVAVALEWGAEDVIQKPFNQLVLSAKIGSHLRLLESRQEVRSLNEQLAAEKRRVQEERDRLARYFSADLIQGILSGEISTRIGGEVRTASILFSDIRNSTQMAEKMGPESFMNLVNNVFTDISDIVYGEGGSVNKFIGDGILATFGCPNRLEDDAYHCAAAALKMRKYLIGYNQSRPKYLSEPLRMGVGMSRGEVFAGNVGSVHQIQYTVLGDPVNLASRLENLTKLSKADTLMCGEMREQLGSRAKVMKVNLDHVRGKLREVRVYFLVDLK
jgi:adenylate cyclase